MDPEENWTEFEITGAGDSGISIQDIEEQLNGALRRLSYGCSRLGPLPDGCTYTLAVELRDRAEVPIGVSLVLNRE